MRLKSIFYLTIIVVSFFFYSCKKQESSSKVEQLLSKMTLEEKVGQMAQITLDVIGTGDSRFSSNEPFVIDTAALRHAVVEYHVGSILNTTNNRALPALEWNQILSQIQQIAVEETKLSIPILYGLDQIHGTTYTADGTFFPHEIALAATFNPIHAYRMAQVTAYETRACGIPWNFSPVLDLGSDPRFPRQFEGFGEDPYVGTVMGVEMVKGMEGDSKNGIDANHVASCMKHFLAYSVPNSGIDRTPSFVPEHILREYHLPAFKAAVENGSHTIMINSGIINGISVHANPDILTKLLREELGFEGVIVSDWMDIDKLYTRDKVASNMKEAIKLAIDAGIDISMSSYDYETFCDTLVVLVKEGTISEKRIDQSVRRILKLKEKLGLFENPVTYLKDYPEFASQKFSDWSREAALEAITLLKNENKVLPIDFGKKILVCGPNANSMRTLNGGWSYSWQGEKTDFYTADFNTIYEAISKQFGQKNVKYYPGVSYVAGANFNIDRFDQLQETITAAKQANYIILCVGENSYAEKPGNLQDLNLSDNQVELAKKLAETGKPIILVINSGRPRCINKIEPLSAAIVNVYLTSNFGGDALAEILAGKTNPSGRLPYTYPRYPSALYTYYHKPSEDMGAIEEGKKIDGDYLPQFEFGQGLSYTTFEYSNLTVNPSVFSDGDSISITVTVKNTGDRAGKESVLLYSSDVYASITPDVKRLRRFQKIDLKPNESRQVNFVITSQDLAFVNTKNEWICEKGDFIIQIGELKKTITKR